MSTHPHSNSTTNHDLFVFVEGNRAINRAKVDYLKKEIQRHNLLSAYPIMVKRSNNRFHVYDGQHRLQAARELKVSIYYTVREDLTMADIMGVQIGNVWKPADYMSSYAETGNEHYANLQRFVEQTKVPITCALSILSDNVAWGGQQRDLFIAGKFKATAWDSAHHIAEILNAIGKHSRVYKDRAYVAAAIRLFRTGKFDAARFAQKLEYQSRKLVKCATSEQALEVIDEIYNFGCRASQIISLTAEVRKNRSEETTSEVAA